VAVRAEEEWRRLQGEPTLIGLESPAAVPVPESADEVPSPDGDAPGDPLTPLGLLPDPGDDPA
jgi:hypothetical protein